MQEIQIYLPFPPSINDYYGMKNIGKRYIKYIKTKGKKYRQAARAEIHRQMGSFGSDELLPLYEKLLVEAVFHMPDRRIRDLDNYKKALLDSCSRDDKDDWVGLWNDDSQIDQLFSYRGAVYKGGIVVMTINEAGPVIPLPEWAKLS